MFANITLEEADAINQAVGAELLIRGPGKDGDYKAMVELVNRHGRALSVERKIRALYIDSQRNLHLKDLRKKVASWKSSISEILYVLGVGDRKSAGDVDLKLAAAKVNGWFESAQDVFEEACLGGGATLTKRQREDEYIQFGCADEFVVIPMILDGNPLIGSFGGSLRDLQIWFRENAAWLAENQPDVSPTKISISVTTIVEGDVLPNLEINFEELGNFLQRLEHDEVPLDYLRSYDDLDLGDRNGYLRWIEEYRSRQYENPPENYEEPIGLDFGSLKSALLAIHTVLDQNVRFEHLAAEFVAGGYSPAYAKGKNLSGNYEGEFSFRIRYSRHQMTTVHLPGSHALFLGHVGPTLFRTLYRQPTKLPQNVSNVYQFEDEPFGQFLVALAKAWNYPLEEIRENGDRNDSIQSAYNSIDILVEKISEYEGVDLDSLPNRQGEENLDEESLIVWRALRFSEENPRRKIADNAFQIDALSRLSGVTGELAEDIEFFASPFKPGELKNWRNKI